jgi:serine/threonine-protein kinase RsbW
MSATESSEDGRDPSRRVPQAGLRGVASPGVAPDRGPNAAIEGLTLLLGRMRRGAAALKAENHQLRAEIALLQPAARTISDAPTEQLGKLAEIALPTGSAAPGAARLFVVHCLTGLVSQRILADATLLVSELITNSVRHADLGEGDTVLVRAYLGGETLRLEIENPGIVGLVRNRREDRQPEEGGFGLALVGLVATRWGVRRGQSTEVWLEMGRT